MTFYFNQTNSDLSERERRVLSMFLAGSPVGVPVHYDLQPANVLVRSTGDPLMIKGHQFPNPEGLEVGIIDTEDVRFSNLSVDIATLLFSPETTGLLSMRERRVMFNDIMESNRRLWGPSLSPRGERREGVRSSENLDRQYVMALTVTTLKTSANPVEFELSHPKAYAQWVAKNPEEDTKRSVSQRVNLLEGGFEDHPNNFVATRLFLSHVKRKVEQMNGNSVKYLEQHA